MDEDNHYFIDPPDDFDPSWLNPDDVDVEDLWSHDSSDLLINGEPVGDVSDFSVSVQTRADSAIQAAVDAYLRELDRHVLGAWMAGYEALDVVTPAGLPRHAGEDVFDPAAPAITGRVRPVEDAEREPLCPVGSRVERYDLRDVDPADVRERRRDRDR